LAIDATSSGERISAEAYSQFADHYYRLHLAAVGAVDALRQTENNNEQSDQPQNRSDADVGQSGDAAGEEQTSKSVDAAPSKTRAPGRPRKNNASNARDNTANTANTANAGASTEVKADGNASETASETASDLPDVASGDVTENVA
jgi:hypothetical protein